MGTKRDTPAVNAPRPTKPAVPTKTASKQIQPTLGVDRAVGLALREARVATGKSQEQLALDAGLDRTYVSLLERGLKSPTLRTLFKLADILDVKASTIVGAAEAVLETSTNPPGASTRKQGAAPRRSLDPKPSPRK